MSVADQTRNYRRGAIMGLTLAEAFILLAFALLLLFAFWQRETEKENTPDVQAFRNLPSDQRKDVLDAVRDGSLETVIKIRNRPENPEEYWRFIDRDEVRRLLEAASRLPEDIQRDLADLVESGKARDVLKQMAVLEKLVAEGRSMSDLIKDIEFLERSGIAGGDLEEWVTAMNQLRDSLSREIGDAGSTNAALEARNAALEADLNELRDSLSREIGDAGSTNAALEARNAALEADLNELRDSLSREIGDAGSTNAALEARNAALEADLNELRDSLSREIGDAGSTNAALETRNATLEADLNELRDGISRKIRDAEAQNAALEATLRDELGDLVSGVGGKIDVGGVTILPDVVLFRSGKADITPESAEFLSKFCSRWLTALVDSEVEIWETRIEGHASSEWRSVGSPHEAYLGNLDLSQRRSQAVLRHCLETVKAPEVLAWSRSHLVAVGYSSARPVMEGGQENRVASRRVVFSFVPNTKSLIAEIESEVQTGGEVR